MSVIKKMHFRTRYNSPIFGWVVRPICRIDNTTYAYTATTVKADVNCLKCLKKITRAK